MSRRFFALAVLAATAACGTQSTTPLTPDEGYTLQQAADSIPLPIGKDVKVADVWMTFGRVTNDSRCPSKVTCVWSGDAVAEIAVHPGCYKEGCKAASIMLSLHTNLDPRSGQGWGRKVTLLALEPYPETSGSVDPARYVAWVRVN